MKNMNKLTKIAFLGAIVASLVTVITIVFTFLTASTAYGNFSTGLSQLFGGIASGFSSSFNLIIYLVGIVLTVAAIGVLVFFAIKKAHKLWMIYAAELVCALPFLFSSSLLVNSLSKNISEATATLVTKLGGSMIVYLGFISYALSLVGFALILLMLLKNDAGEKVVKEKPVKPVKAKEDKKAKKAETKAEKVEEVKEKVEKIEKDVKEKVASLEKKEEPVKEVETRIYQPPKKTKPAPKPKAEEPVPVVTKVVDSESGETTYERISFPARFLASDKALQAVYNELKNELLSYGLKSRVSKSGDTFRLHCKTYAKMIVAGKGLKLYMAMNPDDYKDSTIPVGDASTKGLYKDIPLVFKVKSDLSIKRCKQLIADMMAKDGIAQGPVMKINYIPDVEEALANLENLQDD